MIERGSAFSGEALLQLVRSLRGADRNDLAVDAYLTHAASVPWNAAVDGTSGRWLALLGIGAHLDSSTRETEIATCTEALRTGAVALPAPLDDAVVTAEGFEFTLDPWWTGLRATAPGGRRRRGVAEGREPRPSPCRVGG